MSATAERRGYGGFLIAGMQLALPMSALREVLPCDHWLPLPSAAACVVGGLDLRGVVVPVVDLRQVIGRPCEPIEQPSVVILVVDGHILGLLAEGVTGVFSASTLHPVRAEGPTAALLAGSLRRDDDDSRVSVLSAAAVAALPEVPLVRDPEPARQVEASDAAEVVIDDRSVTMMLFRCGKVPLALDAMAVYTTLSDPQIERSVLSRGHCVGVLDHGGAKVPVVDLMALLGLGPLPQEEGVQAFVLRLPQGLVACLVQEVVDVVRTQPEDRLQVPAFALPHPRLFAGVLPMSALPAEVVQRCGLSAQQFLLLDGAALHAEPALQALSATNTAAAAGSGTAVQAFADPVSQGAGRSMITYALGGETATPIEQVAEILAWRSDIAIYQDRGALLGLLVCRGQSIPVMCLSRLSGFGAIEATPSVSVLVVEQDGQRVGFAVPALKTIEPADWEPELPRQAGAGDDLAAVMGQRKLALVGQGEGQRMLRVLDLQRLARALSHPEALAA